MQTYHIYEEESYDNNGQNCQIVKLKEVVTRKYSYDTGLLKESTRKDSKYFVTVNKPYIEGSIKKSIYETNDKRKNYQRN